MALTTAQAHLRPHSGEIVSIESSVTGLPRSLELWGRTIGNCWEQQSPDDTSGLEETVHGRYQVCSICSCGEVEIFDERWLTYLAQLVRSPSRLQKRVLDQPRVVPIILAV